MSRANIRTVKVIALLVGLGATFGAMSGAGILAGLLALRDGPAALLSSSTWSFLLLPAEFGAVSGAVLGPIFAWRLLRHVPLGRAILWTALGTAFGALLGELTLPFNPYVRGVPALILGGIAGFIAGGIAVRLRTPPTAPTSIREPPYNDRCS